MDGTTILASARQNERNGPQLVFDAPKEGVYYVEVRGYLTDQSGTFNLEIEVDGLPCDYVGETGCDINDLDALYAGTDSVPFTNEAIISWLTQASDPANPLKPTNSTTFVFGDVDLDGDVDSGDLGRLLNTFGDTSELGWGNGTLTATRSSIRLTLDRFSTDLDSPVR